MVVRKKQQQVTRCIVHTLRDTHHTQNVLCHLKTLSISGCVGFYFCDYAVDFSIPFYLKSKCLKCLLDLGRLFDILRLNNSSNQQYS